MSAEVTANTTTILIVDDNADVRSLVGLILARRGYRTVESGSARDALSRARHWSPKIDVLLTDYALPDGDGITLARRFLARFPSAGVVFMSGFLEIPRWQLDNLDARWAFVPKPFRPRKLLETVEAVLKERETRAA
jgi:DNA-binding NtrC family response regulator